MGSAEDDLIDAFIVPGKRERYKLLLGDPRRRAKVLSGLNHCSDLDPRHATELSSQIDIVALLHSRGAPELCYVISDVNQLDGRVMPLEDAIDQTESYMWGTLIGCIPGRLAYYYGERGLQRLLLERGSDKPTRAAPSRRG